jgi:hypothetical protein
MSEIKVNKISPRAACGTVQLGDSGDTFTIPAGATINNQGTALNFGATGSASWVTTVKTSGFTAVAGEGYFVDTTSGGISVNLPAGTPGAVVAFKDYAGTFDTGNLILVQNGSDKIGGSTVNGSLTTEGIAVTLIFIDSTQGWLVTDSGLQDEAPTARFITATGGTITTVDTNFKVHTFTGPGTFQVTCAGNPFGSSSVDYMVIAGGGGSGTAGAGGGGAGGYRESHSTPVSGCYTASPLATPTAITTPVASYPITVGGGGAGLVRPTPIPGAGGARGSNSIFSTITSTGGGGSPSQTEPITATAPGGSGGGLAKGAGGPAGVGNTPPVSPSQGNNGGVNGPQVAGGGGGAGGVGTDGNPAIGGAGTTSEISGSPVTRAGGGGGGSDFPSTPGGPAHPGGGGGGQGGNRPDTNSTNGTDNTGGGAGGQGESAACGTQKNGGSGVVIIRYKFQ